MIIDKLIKKQQLKLLQCTAAYQQHQQLRQAYLWLLAQRSKQFLGSAPGLTLSFGAGVLMQLRHTTAIRTVRRLAGFQWLRFIF